VCVCDDEFCDEPEPTGSPEEDELLLFSSDRQKHRLHRSSIRFSNTSRTEYDDGTEYFHILLDLFVICSALSAASASSSSALIIVNGSVQFQSLLGFGGAFSDSVGLNLNALNWSARERLLRAYFDLETGIGYRLGRVPIASTDFSTREYSYLDKERDFDMESFSLAPEDLELKVGPGEGIPMLLRFQIPYIQMANKMSGNRLQLFAAPWASPAWMKSNGRMSGAGQLKGDLDGPYYRTYAHYLKRWGRNNQG
jgi:glucosylceramidase